MSLFGLFVGEVATSDQKCKWIEEREQFLGELTKLYKIGRGKANKDVVNKLKSSFHEECNIARIYILLR